MILKPAGSGRGKVEKEEALSRLVPWPSKFFLDLMLGNVSKYKQLSVKCSKNVKEKNLKTPVPSTFR